ncbi:VOC family protein [Arthrobacter sp. SD76]|uniref:VOC family protein n=1 Tax=Arthrobacter sp. SD76 TaxID=3415007 RepID=UPI003C71DF04
MARRRRPVLRRHLRAGTVGLPHRIAAGIGRLSHGGRWEGAVSGLHRSRRIRIRRAGKTITTNDEDQTRLTGVGYPVDDLAAAVEFFAEAFGVEPRFADGDRFAALDAGGSTVALTAAEERITTGPAAFLRVGNVDEAVERVRASGGTVVFGPQDGPHERRAVVRDPWGNEIVVLHRL